jgi:hypothetical protein
MDTVPSHIFRQLPKANSMLKERAYNAALCWAQDHIDSGSPGMITATTEDADDLNRINLLSTLAVNRPVAGSSLEMHRKLTVLLVKAFYDDGIINMRVGRNRDTAFLAACSQGNFEIAEVLLAWGAGFSPLG